MPDYPRVPQQISDPISENLAKLAELFPAAVKDGVLDVEALRAELGDYEEIKPGDETYELNWVGKRAAKKEAFKPLLGKTLALKDDGKCTDTTQNLYIEGDNLEALKLLRQNYYGEVKMIYIDPPYNTGSDFVYTDKFAVTSEESEHEEGAVTQEGKRLIKNERSSNRFHARWLDMMFPRLRLAKDLLREDGIIFVSIDDNEVASLQKLCDEVFGEENFIGVFCRKTKSGGGSASDSCATEHDYVVSYARSLIKARPLVVDYDENYFKRYKEKDEIGHYFWDTMERSSTATKPYTIMAPDGKILTGKWFRSEATFLQDLKTGEVRFLKKETGWSVQFKQRAADGKKLRTILEEAELTDKTYRSLNAELEAIMECSLGHPPKPDKLLRTLISSCTTSAEKNCIIIDFFSGSATTGDAVMNVNAEDGGSRRFIMVQLPEICPEESDAAKAGYATVAEIGKERIRRAGEKIKALMEAKHTEWQKKQALEFYYGGKLDLKDDATAMEKINPYIIDPNSLDIGFKSFRIEDTKINWLKKDLRGEQLEFSDTTTQDALDFVPGYTDTDVVYELMLRQSNIPLTGAITRPIASAMRTYLYADSYLVCLELKVTQKLVESLAAIEPAPNKYFFRDSAFGTDIALKDETFRRLKAEIHKHHGDLGAAYTVEFI
jgi:adenine-specific DNA-methyltransferase